MFPSSDFRVGLRLTFRARFLSVGIWFLITLAVMVLLAAQFSGRQPATVSLDVGVSAIRLALPVVIVLLVQELLTREFDRRYFLSSLTYPRPRHWLFLGRFAAAFTAVLVLLTTMGLLLAGLVWLVSSGYAQATPPDLGQHFLITMTFIAIDLFVITTMAAFLAIVATTPSFILIGTLAFMLLARSFSTVILLLTQQQGLVSNPELYRKSLGIMGYLLPDLGALDVRAISLYDTMTFLPSDWPARVISVSAYGVALIGLSLWALHRKRFS